MQKLLRVLTAAFMTVAFVHLSTAASAQPAGEPVAKQIQLTEKQVLGFIAAQKDMAPILEKIQGPSADQLPPQIKAELEAAAKKHGFKDFNDYDEVTANKALPAEEKKQMLEELNEALKSAQPIQFPSNIELVKKHYDKIDAALN